MATGATEFIDNTTADVFIPELWSMEAIVARENQLVFANLVDRKFENGLSFGDTIHVPGVSNLAVRTKSTNGAVTYETVTESNTDISIGTHEYAAIALENITRVQNNRDQLQLYAGKLGYALALAVDDVLAGLVDNFSNNVGTLAVELTDDELLRARQYLDDADAPQDSRVMVVSPAQETGLLKLDRFVHNDYESVHGAGRETGLEKAYVSSFMGMPIYRSVNVEGTNSAGHDNGMFQKEAVALVMQIAPKTYHQFDIDYIVDKVVIEQLYGTQEMRDDHGVFMKGA
uniref:Bacteriophage capsid protein n=1 Tax=uncultured marine thaumarchaeote KM3_54_G11 TaxID=1456193 RepID=A0A075H803_9ARCH|nr:bacteriophage capsid protein [uncultured marine thaumarchaeote KM3_54_G11]